MITKYFLKSIGEDIYKHQEDQRVPHSYYIGLSSSAPNDDGSGIIEPAPTTGYARIEISNDELTFGEADENNVISNHRPLYFPESKEPWGQITHYVIFDELTGGNLLMYGELNESVNIPIKTMLSIPTGKMQITVVNAGE